MQEREGEILRRLSELYTQIAGSHDKDASPFATAAENRLEASYRAGLMREASALREELAAIRAAERRAA